MATIGYGDITAQNTGEQVAAVIIMIVGILVFALLIGSIQEVFAVGARQHLTCTWWKAGGSICTR